VNGYQLPDLAAARTVEELEAGIKVMKDRLTELNTEAGVQPLDDDARAEWDAIDNKEDGTLRAFQLALVEAKARRARVDELTLDPKAREEHRSFTAAPARSRLPEDLFDLPEYRSRTNGDPARMAALMRDGARKISEEMLIPSGNRDNAVAHIAELLAQAGDDPHFAQMLITTTSPSYVRAFGKAISGHSDSMTPSERVSIGSVGSGQATYGGYLAPVILDPSVMLTSDGASNPVRRLARTVTIVGAGNTWNGVSSSGIILGYGPAEKTAIAENTIAFGQPTVTAQPVKGEVKMSVESMEDIPTLLSELSRIIRDARDVLEADQFVNGIGSGVYPGGVVSTLDAASLVGTGGNGFGLDDVTRLLTRVPERFQANTSVLAHRTVFGEYDDLVEALGGTPASEVAGRGAQTIKGGYPRYSSSAMEQDYTTATNDIMLAGDFRAGYLIVDKAGLAIQDAGFVRDTNGALTGERALFIHCRNSAVITVDNAFRLLRVGVVQS
jgi:HK97 family phage major capsid protein